MGRCELAIVDVRDGAVTRIARNVQVGWFNHFKPSPDGLYIAYTAVRGRDTASQWNVCDLHLFDIRAKQDRIIAADIQPGFPLAWSPDGRRLAYHAIRAERDGNRRKQPPADIAVVSIVERSGRSLVRT